MRFFFAVLTEAIQIFFSSVHLPGISVSLQYPLSMRIHDSLFPESASFKRKEQGVREEGRGKKKNTNHPKRVIDIFGGGRWISPDGDKLRLHLPRKEKYQSPKRVIGIFGGGRWISPDGDKLRLHLPGKEKYRPSRRTIGIFGGGRWIRTIEGIASRFTVCPLWPLGNSPICIFVRRWSW